MSPRGSHLDVEATASARLTRVLRDRRSFIATDGRVFLEGKDVRRARARVFGRDEGMCVDCGAEVRFDNSGFWSAAELTDMGYGCGVDFGVMELSHEKPKSLGGDDSDENLRTRCRRCHRKKDGHGQDLHF
jgi:5-methylcytosine-specific restriction endonuclease McrA